MTWEQEIVTKLGKNGIRELAAAFYRQVAGDDLLGPMYPTEELSQAETRLADFLCFRLAGDPTYLETRGHPRLRMRHFPFKIGIAERDRWILLMTNAMDEIGLHGKEREALEGFFAHTADFMRNQEEPAAGS
ncbi:globin [Luteolibacter pohnpeiensis]|uniref:Globin n=1 Tax=Luteolibacter pohnpeiensis TaxID=454153 RepID=A0A934S611_9BACT|nr:globin [Luteolibacter pohnpeiensis]MBK1881819.1 globin [Luteolibacter pohnpeiensis]